MVSAKSQEESIETARRIGVSESTLREATEGRSRLAAISVIQALVSRGVDAKWMLTGEIDSVLHRRMLEARPEQVESMIKRVTAASR
jgi:hypothetical protein